MGLQQALYLLSKGEITVGDSRAIDVFGQTGTMDSIPLT